MRRKGIVSRIRVLLLAVLIADLLIAGSSQAASGTGAASLHISEGGEIFLTSGEKKTLSASVDSASDVETKIVWTTSNESIVHISEQGEMTANKKGRATIQAKEIYSGLTASVTVVVKPEKIEYVKRPVNPSVTLKKETDFAGTYLDWSCYREEDISYFIVFFGYKPEKRSKVIYESVKTTKFSYAHKKLKKGKKYHYYVSAFNSEGKKLATSKKMIVRATEPNIGLQRASGGYNEVVWKRQDKKHIKGISGYRIYRSKRADGAYKCVKQINSPKKISWIDKKPPYGTCYYKVRAFKKKGKKRIYGVMSKYVASDDYYSVVTMGEE